MEYLSESLFSFQTGIPFKNKEGCDRTRRVQSQKQRRLKTGMADFAKAVFSDDVFI